MVGILGGEEGGVEEVVFIFLFNFFFGEGVVGGEWGCWVLRFCFGLEIVCKKLYFILLK